MHIHTYIRTYIHKYIHTYVRTYVHIHIHKNIWQIDLWINFGNYYNYCFYSTRLQIHRSVNYRDGNEMKLLYNTKFWQKNLGGLAALHSKLAVIKILMDKTGELVMNFQNFLPQSFVL